MSCEDITRDEKIEDEKADDQHSNVALTSSESEFRLTEKWLEETKVYK